MTTDIVLVIFTAVITTVLTLAAAWFLYRRYLERMIVTWIDEKADELGRQLEGRVREGVRKGIKDGVSDVGDNVVRRTAESAAKTGFGMIEDGMNLWFRAGRKKPDD